MLGVIIVAYKNPQRTINFINAQLPHLKPEHIIVVVNNSSTLEECKKLGDVCGGVACLPDDIIGKYKVYIIQSDNNLGFAQGNNLGVRFLQRNNPCDYILFSNDDIIIEKGTDLTPMIELIEKDKSIGAIGPDIIGLDGRHQSPHRRKISAYRQIGWMLFPWLRKNETSVSNNIEDSAPPIGECYWVSGAFFLMRSGYFSTVNGFDPDTFLYSEEPILAERLKRLGLRMYFDPSIRITHLDGGTTKETIGNNRIMRLIIESNCIYYRKYLKTPKIFVALYKYLATRQWNLRCGVSSSERK